MWTAYGSGTAMSGFLPRFFHGWRMQMRVRLREFRYVASFRHGLKIGLPYATIIAATIPMAGMSWYFPTENWASGVRYSWAAERTDTWREAMIRAVDPDANETFSITSPGVSDAGDFSFVVVRDPGEGDASQLALSSGIVSTSQ